MSTKRIKEIENKIKKIKESIEDKETNKFLNEMKSFMNHELNKRYISKINILKKSMKRYEEEIIRIKKQADLEKKIRKINSEIDKLSEEKSGHKQEISRMKKVTEIDKKIRQIDMEIDKLDDKIYAHNKNMKYLGQDEYNQVLERKSKLEKLRNSYEEEISKTTKQKDNELEA